MNLIMGKQENAVENLLCREVMRLGGVTRKYKSQPGVADRLCFLPYGILYLAEVKTYNGKESPLQVRERNRMTGLGFRSRVVYGEESVMNLIDEMKEELREKSLNFI